MHGIVHQMHASVHFFFKNFTYLCTCPEKSPVSAHFKLNFKYDETRKDTHCRR